MTEPLQYIVGSEALNHCIGGRFGAATQFQFNSDSFDLWAADIRGGAVWGFTYGAMAYEAFFFDETETTFSLGVGVHW